MVGPAKRKRDEEFPLSRQDSTQQPTASSLVRNTEEVSFPRGGASILTPLELKQVANEAAGDVLFNKNEDNAESKRPQKKPKQVKKSSKKDKKSNSESAEDDAEDEETLSVIQHLNFKTLKVGSSLLGQVSKITRGDICITCSDGISGYVNLTRISDQFTTILEDLDDDMESDDETKNDEEYDLSDDEEGKERKAAELPDLNDYFKLGQWLRCSIVSNSTLEPKSKQNNKRRIEFTIEPTLVNAMSEEDLQKFMPLQCAVKSIEDHGAILDIGIDGMTGFITKKDVPNFDKLLVGSVFLGNVYKKTERSVNVNLDFANKKNIISQISSVDAIVPGQLVDLLCQQVSQYGISGKVFGLVPGFIGSSHLLKFKEEELKHSFAIGSNVRARILASLIDGNGDKTLILSTLPHIQSLETDLKEISALDAFPIGYIFENSIVKGRDSDYLYLALDEDRLGKVHRSKIGKLESIDNLRARVLGYNSVDKIYELAVDPNVLKMQYIRTKDIPAGELLAACEIETVSSSGIQLKILNGQFTASVPPLHISDTRLVYPERKFKIGSKVKGRVLTVDQRGRVFMTLKKSLVNIDTEETPIVSSFALAQEVKNNNKKTVATVQSFRPSGCVVSFFGGIRGFLPNAEISEVFVKRPEEHLRLGQTVSVKLLQVDEEKARILTSCKISSEQSQEQKDVITNLVPGKTFIDVVAVEKTKDSIIVEMSKTGLRGVIYVGHLSDSRIEQNRAALKKITIGAEFNGLVIDKDVRTQVFNLTLKKSLIKAAKNNTLPTQYSEIKSVSKAEALPGYVKSISNNGVFVAFNGKFVGLVLPSYAVDSRDIDISKIFYVNQSVTAYLLRTDDKNERFLLTLKAQKEETAKKTTSSEIVNPIDPAIQSLNDLTTGKVVSAKIKSVKKNQLNIVIADNIHGRVDVAEIFDDLKDIKDRKQPLSAFKKDQTVKVKIIGYHNIKSHKFLPITHQVSKGSVLELSMKPSLLNSEDTFSKTIKEINVGEELVGYVNNFASNNLWLTISPVLKARLSVFDLAGDNTELSENVEDSFPLGSAIPVKVTSIDSEHGFITVANKYHTMKDINSIKVGESLPARIAKIFEKYILLDLGNKLTGMAFATDALDDFSVTLQDAFHDKVNQIVMATIVSLDVDSKKVNLSLRTKDAKTPTITSHDDLKKGDIVHALVKSVSDKGIFLHLSRTLEAFVPVTMLSDSYLKEWKKFYKSMQHVVGKVVKCDEDARILITLRESEVNGELKVLKNYDDIEVGDVVSGSVKNVTDFGVFVKLDNTVNVSGLAHISEIADKKPEDISALFGPGDRVKTIVLKTNPEKKQLSLSLKASRFTTAQVENEEEHSDDEMHEQIEFDNANEESEDEEQEDESEKAKPQTTNNGLSLSTGFDWTASILDQAQESEASEDSQDEDFTETKKHKNRKKRARITEDKTIDINTRAPESVSDFERMIMGNPNSSIVWMNYMAFQLQLSEVEKAREIAERALKTINFRDEAEKLNIWIAMLNLENTFGTSDTLEDVFKRACQYMDSFTIHNKLLTIYQISEKYNQTSELYKSAAKKFGSEKVSIWISWGDFLITQKQEEEARSILSKALKVLPKRDHIELVRKFAQLEFTKGDAERGRSLFEGLIADAPKRIDLWNVYIDQEIKLKEKKKVEELLERVILKKITKKQAKFFFNKWLQFEEAQGDSKAIEYVKAKATEYVEKSKAVEAAT
ncbi:hypothetical protein KAFR_0B03400 [Kazachstania africana CBS 2517]|uniref:rRNA biogenesis protein RRP5 n=1 Tax=Kazachstania africana (strain ATCC 22294 / BCRC 22015 / CBS 2517 / CECT 1963 / NBRC 1671 / NRRL Y-8276) TaxID=1071382 RepID=H2AQI7_KAZAF|nr:hypothetical protein KAFR_0B03400 [Kazachstania africana CBS 2517]CCF56637.1 hypothetical protein KAFR_0B03400 [Kazachstania africana CBS 2517]